MGSIKNKIMNFQQVAHFYLGCEMERADGSAYTLLPSSMPNNFDRSWVTYVGKPVLKKFPDDMSEQDEEETGLNKTYEKGHAELNPYDFWYLITNGFDLFGLIDNKEAIRQHSKQTNNS